MKHDFIAANADKETKEAVREIAFANRKSVRQWAGEVIKKAVDSYHKTKKSK